MSAESQIADAVVDAGRLPMTYAQALLGAAGDASAEEVVAELREFVNQVLPAVPGLKGVLASSFVSQEDKERLLQTALEGKASNVFLNFLKVSVRNNRASLFPAVLANAEKMLLERKNQVQVLVRSAAPLDNASQEVVLQRMRTILQREPVLQMEVDPSLLGGLVIRVGDTLLDGSVATRLKKFRSAMIDRSIHEIQYGRDRFHSAT